MLCDAAVDAGHRTPRTALFVDYSNLPEAVPEFVFPHHFGLKYEIDEVSEEKRYTRVCLSTPLLRKPPYLLCPAHDI